MIMKLSRKKLIALCLFASYLLLAIGELFISMPINYSLMVAMKTIILAHLFSVNLILICVVFLFFKRITIGKEKRVSKIIAFSFLAMSALLFLLLTTVVYAAGNTFFDIKSLQFAGKYGWVLITFYRIFLDFASLLISLFVAFLLAIPLFIYKKYSAVRV